MSFLAQIDLNDVAGIDWGGPTDGLLSFFVRREYEGDSLLGETVAILHQPLSGTTVRDLPDGVEDRLAPIDITFKPELCLPWIGTEPSHLLVNIGMDTDTDTEDRYLELCDSLVERQGLPSPRSGGPAIWEADRFAGHPGFVQSDPIFDAAEDTGDVDLSGRPSTSGWRHLLQITEFEEGEELGTYICAPTDANGWRFSEAQVSTHHGG